MIVAGRTVACAEMLRPVLSRMPGIRQVSVNHHIVRALLEKACRFTPEHTGKCSVPVWRIPGPGVTSVPSFRCTHSSSSGGSKTQTFNVNPFGTLVVHSSRDVNILPADPQEYPAMDKAFVITQGQQHLASVCQVREEGKELYITDSEQNTPGYTQKPSTLAMDVHLPMKYGEILMVCG